MKRRTEEERDGDDRERLERGERLVRFMEDPYIAGWFSQKKTEAVTKMLGAAIGDDDTRRDGALLAKSIEELEQSIKTEIAFAKRAKGKLDDRIE